MASKRQIKESKLNSLFERLHLLTTDEDEDHTHKIIEYADSSKYLHTTQWEDGHTILPFSSFCPCFSLTLPFLWLAPYTIYVRAYTFHIVTCT